VSYVPDAGHKRLIELCHARQGHDGRAAHDRGGGRRARGGAWLGGERAAPSHAVEAGWANCANALTLVATCGFPLLMLVTMRGEAGRAQIPGRLPMGRGDAGKRCASPAWRTLRLSASKRRAVVANTAVKIAFEEQNAVALLISQRLDRREVLRGKAVKALNRREVVASLLERARRAGWSSPDSVPRLGLRRRGRTIR